MPLRNKELRRYYERLQGAAARLELQAHRQGSADATADAELNNDVTELPPLAPTSIPGVPNNTEAAEKTALVSATYAVQPGMPVSRLTRGSCICIPYLLQPGLAAAWVTATTPCSPVG